MVLDLRRRFISIHALREEGDHLGIIEVGFQRNFYPRPPRGGRPQCYGQHDTSK